MRGENMLLRWQNSASKLVPDHSKIPRSRQTLNVIGVGTAATPTWFKKFRKFAGRVIKPCQRSKMVLWPCEGLLGDGDMAHGMLRYSSQ